jgi:hypothetical protein
MARQIRVSTVLVATFPILVSCNNIETAEKKHSGVQATCLLATGLPYMQLSLRISCFSVNTLPIIPLVFTVHTYQLYIKELNFILCISCAQVSVVPHFISIQMKLTISHVHDVRMELSLCHFSDKIQK